VKHLFTSASIPLNPVLA